MMLNDVITVLLVATFLLLALFRAKRWRTWSSVLLGLAVLAEIIRVSHEHERWQMRPALFALALSLIVTVLMYRGGFRRWVVMHRKTRVFASIALLLVLAGTAGAYALFPMFELPHPTGAMNIGTMELHLVDTSRGEVHTANPLDHRELMVKVWYPADAGGCKKFAPYLEHVAAIVPALNQRLWPLGTTLSHLDQVPTHACVEAPVASQQGSYPVLIFSHGLSLGYAAQNTVLMEELASRGYVIFSIDHPYDGLAAVFPNGRVATWRQEGWDAHDVKRNEEYERAREQLGKRLDPQDQIKLARLSLQNQPVEADLRRFWYEQWSLDQRFVLDQLVRVQSGDQPTPLAGRLALDRIGIFGMSFGGATAAWTCARDERCKAGINLDGFGNALAEIAPHRQPFMSMNSEGQVANSLFLDTDLSYRYYAQVKGSTHMDYGDTGLISPIAKKAMGDASSESDPIPTLRMLQLTNAYVTAFFDRHLLGRPCELLDAPSTKYPEVIFIAKQPQEGAATSAPKIN